MDSKKKKKGQEPKVKPRRGEVWEDTKTDGVADVYHIISFYQDGKRGHGFTCRVVSEDGQGNQFEVTKDVPLLKFGEPGMKVLDDSKAQDDEPAPAENPSVIVTPIKNGVSFTCPGIKCGDKFEFKMESMSFAAFIEKLTEEHDNFVLRHEPHMRDGTLFGRHEA